MIWLYLAIGLAAAFALHRILLWMESRGWIYYMHRRGSGNALGNAFLELQSIVEPEKKHVMEARRRDRAEQEDAGDGPEAGEANHRDSRPPATPGNAF